ncbi:hypothetical protein NicSoilB8_39760 [Arthrobacter sp. NicSoilB8]|nr:hypothetical protein NicSoilB8_39760 [Arthrobacter sp. NicSoilB8]
MPWISAVETPFTAFSFRKQGERVLGRLLVRRIQDLNPRASPGQPTIFPTCRLRAFIATGALDTVAADKTHRGHAIIEQVNADLNDSALGNPQDGAVEPDLQRSGRPPRTEIPKDHGGTPPVAGPGTPARPEPDAPGQTNSRGPQRARRRIKATGRLDRRWGRDDGSQMAGSGGTGDKLTA